MATLKNNGLVEPVKPPVAADSPGVSQGTTYLDEAGNKKQGLYTSDLNRYDIIQQMKNLSAVWHTSTPEQRKALADQAYVMGTALGASRDKDGVWWSLGKRLYDTIYQAPEIKPPEVPNYYEDFQQEEVYQHKSYNRCQISVFFLSHIRPLIYTASGNLISKVLPAPSLLSTETLPPCSSAISFTIASPRPLPPSDPRDVSACQNLCQILSRFSAEIPIPLSRTLITASLPSLCSDSLAYPFSLPYLYAFSRRL